LISPNCFRRWWRMLGRKSYPRARRLLICADAGAATAIACAWKVHLQRLASEIGILVSVAHYPPGTSKWNEIEHRLFSFINIHWHAAGELRDCGRTHRRRAHAQQTQGEGPAGYARIRNRSHRVRRGITDLHLRGHSVHPDWNYTLSPATIPRIRAK